MHTPDQAREMSQAEKELTEFLATTKMTPDRAREIIAAREKRKAERAAQDHVAAHLRSSLADLVGKRPSVEQVTQRVEDALQELAPPQVQFTVSGLDDGVLIVDFEAVTPIGGAQ